MGDVSTTDSAEANATDEGTPKLRTVPLPALRVGMYVHLNCSWFLHPFAHQQFMLSSKEQVERIIALNLPVQVDPSRSDVPLDLDGTTGDEPAAGPSEPAVDSETAVAEPSAPVPATPTPKTPKPQSLDSYRSDLREAEQLCKEACADFQRAFQELGAGHDTGVAGAKTVITMSGSERFRRKSWLVGERSPPKTRSSMPVTRTWDWTSWRRSLRFPRRLFASFSCTMNALTDPGIRSEYQASTCLC